MTAAPEAGENQGVNDVRPARPHHKLTEDGRRMREVLSYSRRGSRFTPRQAESWAAHQADWVIPEEAVDRADFSLTERFGREAPLILEIGSGIGEATAVLAAARPDHNVLALDVWLPGVADSLWRVAEAGADNVRFCSVDAVWTLENLLDPASLAEIWTFFPDPWRKTKHRKRRLVNPANAALASSRLVPGGAWRLATDWADYADQMRVVLDAEPTLEGGPVERWAERPVTRFERKGRDVGRDIADFCYRRTSYARRVEQGELLVDVRVGLARSRRQSALRASCTSRAPSTSPRLRSDQPTIQRATRVRGVGRRSARAASALLEGAPARRRGRRRRRGTSRCW